MSQNVRFAREDNVSVVHVRLIPNAKQGQEATNYSTGGVPYKTAKTTFVKVAIVRKTKFVFMEPASPKVSSMSILTIFVLSQN